MIYLVPKPEAPAPVKPPAADLEAVLARIPYRHITQQIRRTWGTGACDPYLNSLLMNDRQGDREGFPPAVSHAIFSLITMNELTRRMAGENPGIDHVSGVDWANASGRWKIVKSRESKQPIGKAPAPGEVSFGVVKT